MTLRYGNPHLGSIRDGRREWHPYNTIPVGTRFCASVALRMGLPILIPGGPNIMGEVNASPIRSCYTRHGQILRVSADGSGKPDPYTICATVGADTLVGSFEKPQSMPASRIPNQNKIRKNRLPGRAGPTPTKSCSGVGARPASPTP